MIAILYSNHSMECQRAEALLQSMDQKYVRYDLERDFTLKQFIEEFGPEAPFPQVAIGIKHIGTLKDTLNYYAEKGML